MSVFYLATCGVDCGTLSGTLTPDERESLAIVVQTIRLDREDRAMIETASHEVEKWQPTQSRVVNLARCHIKQLIDSGKIRLLARAPPLSSPPRRDLNPQISQFCIGKGFNSAYTVRGQQDMMAFVLMEQLDRLLVTPDYPANHRPPVTTSTFEGKLSENFDSLCRPAHEILVLFKSVVTALGDPQEPDQVTVFTTLADYTKWPRSTLMVVRLAMNFTLSQIRMRRVVLVRRHEGHFLGSISASEDGMDYSEIIAGCRDRAHRHGLPETWVDTVDCLFDGPVNNHIVEIARTCMQLAGNQPLPRLGAGATRGQHTVEGPAGAQDSDAGGDGSCHTAADSVAMLAGVGAKVPAQTQVGPISRDSEETTSPCTLRPRSEPTHDNH